MSAVANAIRFLASAPTPLIGRPRYRAWTSCRTTTVSRPAQSSRARVARRSSGRCGNFTIARARPASTSTSVGRTPAASGPPPLPNRLCKVSGISALTNSRVRRCATGKRNANANSQYPDAQRQGVLRVHAGRRTHQQGARKSTGEGGGVGGACAGGQDGGPAHAVAPAPRAERTQLERLTDGPALARPRSAGRA